MADNRRDSPIQRCRNANNWLSDAAETELGRYWQHTNSYTALSDGSKPSAGLATPPDAHFPGRILGKRAAGRAFSTRGTGDITVHHNG